MNMDEYRYECSTDVKIYRCMSTDVNVDVI